jgi:Zn finger protein HypA/HybF involved in hydrogenase expression
MTKKRKNKLIMCEHCNQWVAAIIYNYNYYCADCALSEEKILEGTLIENASLSRKIQ